MSDCFTVSLDCDGYQFTPSEKGDIHVVELTDVTQIRSVNIEASDPATTVLSHATIEDYVVKSPPEGTGAIGMPVEHLDRFLDRADQSPHSVTVSPEVKAYIEGL